MSNRKPPSSDHPTVQPTVTLSALAYLKLHLLALAPSISNDEPNPLRTRETAALLIPDPADPFKIIDIFVPRQQSTAASFEIDPTDSLSVFDTSPNALPCCTNLIFHTHPGESATPSGGDDSNWRTVQSTGPFAMMLIFGRPTSPTAFPEFSLRVRYPLGPAVIPGFPALASSPPVYDGPAKLLYYCPFRAFLEDGTPFPLSPADRLAFLQSALAANPGAPTITPATIYSHNLTTNWHTQSESKNEALKRSLYAQLSSFVHPPFQSATSQHARSLGYIPLSEAVNQSWLIPDSESFPYLVHPDAAPVIRKAWHDFIGNMQSFMGTLLTPVATWLASSLTPYFAQSKSQSDSGPLVQYKRATSFSKWRAMLTPSTFPTLLPIFNPSLNPTNPEDTWYEAFYAIEWRPHSSPISVSDIKDFIADSRVFQYDESTGAFRISWSAARDEWEWTPSDVSRINTLLLTLNPDQSILAVGCLLRYELAWSHICEHSTFSESDALDTAFTEVFDELVTSLTALKTTTQQELYS
jgi:hypothetical protein